MERPLHLHRVVRAICGPARGVGSNADGQTSAQNRALPRGLAAFTLPRSSAILFTELEGIQDGVFHAKAVVLGLVVRRDVQKTRRGGKVRVGHVDVHVLQPIRSSGSHD